VCAVIAAAGRGSRLGGGVPKILLPLAPEVTVWDALAARLAPAVARIHVVLSPEGRDLFGPHASGPHRAEITLGVQDPPRGMGDAVFGARAAWEAFDALLVVWGDQAGLSAATVRRTIAAHAEVAGPRITLPLVSMEDPYVDYVFEPATGALTRILQRREGDHMGARGEADVGVFCLSTAGLAAAWDDYARAAEMGAATGEINFLPFLAHLSSARGFRVIRVSVADPVEARGINTPEDLAFFRARST
jgi:bifunctional UDP-N-acetylglucosamine pyrophosphorylase/glucosamine-1-phosphate N-acetyltransferase